MTRTKGTDQIQNGLESIIAGVHKQQGKYVNEFLSTQCAPDMLSIKPRLYPSGVAAKELTESMGAYNAIRRGLGWDLGDSTTTAYVVGDGSTPRTGALIAFRTAWSVVSIDPSLVRRWPEVRRLQTIGKRIDDCPVFEPEGDAVIVAVHSHALLAPCVERIRPRGRLAIVAIPCCVELELEGKPDAVYADLGIWSPKREVQIWRNVLPSERAGAHDVVTDLLSCSA